MFALSLLKNFFRLDEYISSGMKKGRRPKREAVDRLTTIKAGYSVWKPLMRLVWLCAFNGRVQATLRLKGTNFHYKRKRSEEAN